MYVDLQIATNKAFTLPQKEQFNFWSNAVIAKMGKSNDSEITIRLVDKQEIQQLNNDYRGKNKPTNVLSFPFEPYEALVAYAGDAADINFLGDIIIAPEVIESEAQEQHKKLINHYAHMTIHGLLHLLGYDHVEEEEAITMESVEIEILAELGFPSPY